MVPLPISFIFLGDSHQYISDINVASGGSATVNDLTGMNIVAAILLLPLGVVIYTLLVVSKLHFD